jgi:hypothetical protein
VQFSFQDSISIDVLGFGCVPQDFGDDLQTLAFRGRADPTEWPWNTEFAELILLVFHGPTTEEFLKSLSGSCGGEKPHL